MLRAVLTLTLLLTTSLWADDLAKLQRDLARQSDPGRRAKISVKIAEELLRQTHLLYREDSFEEAQLRLDDYFSTVRSAFDDLQNSGRDARRKPNGFKNLEIHLRKSQRRLRDVSRALPLDRRAPVETALSKLKGMQKQLLLSLMGLTPPDKEGP